MTGRLLNHFDAQCNIRLSAASAKINQITMPLRLIEYYVSEQTLGTGQHFIKNGTFRIDETVQSTSYISYQVRAWAQQCPAKYVPYPTVQTWRTSIGR